VTRSRIVLGAVAAIIVVTIPLIASSCATARDAAEAATREFRARMAGRSYGEIVKSATPAFQKATTEADFSNAMTAVRERLGVWQSSEEPTWKVFAGVSAQTVTLVYSSYFERGTATEEFVWRVQAGRPALDGYHVKSSKLVAQ
jgi:hypothetical protein